MKIAVYTVLIYIVLLTVVFFMQRRLLYFPSTVRPSEESVRAIHLAFWPSPDEHHRGFISTGHEDGRKGTIVVFHGNAGAAVDRSYYARALTPLGYRVLLAEYPGYGGRLGRPSEAALIADAQETVALAHKEFGQPIYLWGESLGCGVVTAIASDANMPITAIVLVTPWDSLPNLAQTIYWYLPARWLILDKFDNTEKLQLFPGPVAVVLAAQDEVIPLRHGLRLYEAVSSHKKLWVFENAGHNSWPIQSEALWWQEVMEFISEPNSRN